jgi:peroxiredoxin
MEHTQKLAQAFPEQLVVLAVSQDGPETRGKAREYLHKKGYRFTLLFDDERRRDLQIGFVPARFVVDKAGLLRIKEFGWTPAQEPVFERKFRALAE